jgi:hypothetical protein
MRISGYHVLQAGHEVIQIIREQVKRRMQELEMDGTSIGKPFTPNPSPRSGERGAE